MRIGALSSMAASPQQGPDQNWRARVLHPEIVRLKASAGCDCLSTRWASIDPRATSQHPADGCPQSDRTAVVDA